MALSLQLALLECEKEDGVEERGPKHKGGGAAGLSPPRVKQRKLLPAFSSYCRRILGTSGAKVARVRQRKRARNISSIRKTMAKPVKVHGQSYKSQRMVRAALKLSHKQLLELL